MTSSDLKSLTRPSSNARRQGFALLVVIWGLGAISLLVISFLSTSRLRLQTAHNMSAAARADSIAAAAIDLAILDLVHERSPNFLEYAPIHDGAPHYCTLGNAAVAVSIQDEGGKIDINAASEQLLQDTFTALMAMPTPKARDLAASFSDFRTQLQQGQPVPPNIGKHPFPPKRSPFETILEIDQVTGVDEQTFNALLPFITVHSRSSGLDPNVAPPALIAALSGLPYANINDLAKHPFPNGINRDDPRFPQSYRKNSPHNAFGISADVLLDDATSARQTIVETQTRNGELYSIREIRHGPPRFSAGLSRITRAGAALPPC